MIPVPTPGAIGSIETPDEEVRQLALKVGLVFALSVLVTDLQVSQVRRDSEDYPSSDVRLFVDKQENECVDKQEKGCVDKQEKECVNKHQKGCVNKHEKEKHRHDPACAE